MTTRSQYRNLWYYLKSAELVAEIQQWFGVSRTSSTNYRESKRQKSRLFGPGSDTVGKENNSKYSEFVIKNYFWYYLSCFGTALGDETFYGAFFPFWFWNVDGSVGRKIVMIWAIAMYIGQGLKDIIRWPRPSSPPVVRLDKKWALEYGMPSTHAIAAVVVPFSTLLYTVNWYQHSIFIGVIAAIIWCSVVCMSRLYLGMHTVLDVLAGLCLTSLIFFPLICLADWQDHFVLTNDYAIVAIWAVILVLIVCYPRSDRWTPARGDTIIIISFCAGLQSGAWACYQLGLIHDPPLHTSYSLTMPTYKMLGLTILRTIVGLSIANTSRAVFKWASRAVLCAIMHLNPADLAAQENSVLNRRKITVEIGYKLVTYTAMGFNAICLSQAVFRTMGIERLTF